VKIDKVIYTRFMDRDRLKSTTKLFNLKQAAQKLGVSVDTLQYLSDRYAVVPTIDSKGEFWYNLDDLQSLLSHNSSQVNQTTNTNAIGLNEASTDLDWMGCRVDFLVSSIVLQSYLEVMSVVGKI
jgi:hypothetical protein